MKDSLVEVTAEVRVRAHYATLYLLAMDLPDNGGVLVKIGTAERPLERYQALITGLPFPSVMFWSPADGQNGGYCAEHGAHLKLADYNTTREWFRFQDTAGVAVMLEAVEWAYRMYSMQPPQWRKITEDDLRGYQKRKHADKQGRKRVGRMLAA